MPAQPPPAGWAASQGPRADWEGSQQASTLLSYSGPTDPIYSVTFQKFDGSQIPRPGRTPDYGDDFLVDVTFDGLISIGDPASINTVGVVYAELFYGLPSASLAPIGFGNNFPPTFTPQDDSACVLVAALEAFDPTSLPVGGVNFPIWTHLSVDALTVRTYARDQRNPGQGGLLGVVAVQINGNAVTANGCQVTTRFRWNQTQ